MAATVPPTSSTPLIQINRGQQLPIGEITARVTYDLAGAGWNLMIAVRECL
jgi:hypothetical protein